MQNNILCSSFFGGLDLQFENETETTASGNSTDGNFFYMASVNGFENDAVIKDCEGIVYDMVTQNALEVVDSSIKDLI